MGMQREGLHTFGVIFTLTCYTSRKNSEQEKSSLSAERLAENDVSFAEVLALSTHGNL
jgi:hypothetical protein